MKASLNVELQKLQTLFSPRALFYHSSQHQSHTYLKLKLGLSSILQYNCSDDDEHPSHKCNICVVLIDTSAQRHQLGKGHHR